MPDRTFALAAVVLASPLLSARQSDTPPQLPRVRATFAAGDFNGDRMIDEAERQRIGLPPADGPFYDLEGDGLWSEDEFILYYRRLLLKNSRPVAHDLDLHAGLFFRAFKESRAAVEERTAAVPPPTVASSTPPTAVESNVAPPAEPVYDVFGEVDPALGVVYSAPEAASSAIPAEPVVTSEDVVEVALPAPLLEPTTMEAPVAAETPFVEEAQPQPEWNPVSENYGFDEAPAPPPAEESPKRPSLLDLAKRGQAKRDAEEAATDEE